MLNNVIGIGLKRSKNNITLDCWFPIILTNVPSDTFQSLNGQPFSESLLKGLALSTEESSLISAMAEINHEGYSKSERVIVTLETTANPVKHAEDAYLKLHLMSKRLAKPHTLNLEGLFGALANVAWSNSGPILPEDVDAVRVQDYVKGRTLTISHVDKFPYLVNYHIPSGVRIASGSQVRLGAYLGAGTTIMPAGYVNFNAGSEGPAMVEGRISAGVVIGKNSDIGGGASVMGTLSGGNNHVISIGDNCLIGANAGTGISLGNGCTIAAGLYVYAGKKVALFNKHKQPIDQHGNIVDMGKNTVKAMALSGRDHLLFIENSQTGQLECHPNQKQIELNEALHTND